MKHTTTQQTLAVFWRYTKRYRRLFYAGTFGAMVGVLSQGIIATFIVSRAFIHLQTAYATHTALQFTSLLPYVIGFAICMVIGLVAWRLQAYAVWQYEIRAVRDMIVDVFNHLEHQGYRFHADRFGGALVSQTNKFASAYERLMDDFTWNIVPSLTVFFASIGILAVVAWQFAVLLVGIIIVYVTIMSFRIRHQFPYNRREAETESARTAALADAITNVANIRAFAREDYELERFKKAADTTLQAYHELSVEGFKNDSISHTMTNTLRISSLLFGIFAITSLHANAGTLYLVINYAAAIVDQLWQFGRVVRNTNRSLGDAAEMTEMLQLQPEVVDPLAPQKAAIKHGRIEFRDVSFAHEGGGLLFDRLNLRIKPGEKIGLVGKSGGGKTTLTSLLLRFLDIQDGSILIDGQDIRSILQSDLRNHIAYVPQEPLLFHRTIAENIGYGQLQSERRAIEEVAKLAHAHDFVAELPDGYETLVGERGVKLSGGQRQRIAIARAMLKNAPILALDEATSALDSESEVLIQDALWKLMEGRTALVIAHRLSTIQKMDRIIVLDEGKIVEQGTHKELIRMNGTYAKLWQHQSGGFLEE